MQTTKNVQGARHFHDGSSKGKAAIAALQANAALQLQFRTPGLRTDVEGSSRHHNLNNSVSTSLVALA